MMLKFSKPKLHDCGGDPKGRWYIDYRIWYEKGTSKRYQKWIPKCKGILQRRRRIAKEMLKDISTQLRLGHLAEKLKICFLCAICGPDCSVTHPNKQIHEQGVQGPTAAGRCATMRMICLGACVQTESRKCHPIKKPEKLIPGFLNIFE